MAQMDTSSDSGKKKGKKVRSKKMSTKIDFTPMVDLGFLLITFFMLTTTMSKPQKMDITYPFKDDKEVKKPDEPEVKASKVITLIPGGNNKVYYYNGLGNAEEEGSTGIDSTDFSKDGLRKVLLQKRSDVQAQHGKDEKPIVMIKADTAANFKNFVDVLDELRITGNTVFVINDITKGEMNYIRNPAQGLKLEQ